MDYPMPRMTQFPPFLTCPICGCDDIEFTATVEKKYSGKNWEDVGVCEFLSGQDNAWCKVCKTLLDVE